MKSGRTAVLFILACTGAQAQDTTAPPLPFDSPVSMRAMEAVCTGIGADARNDPRWPSYPLRIELVGRAGEYLGQASVTLTQNGEAIISVRCGGPWLLLRLPPGAYDVSARGRERDEDGAGHGSGDRAGAARPAFSRTRAGAGEIGRI